MNEHVVLLWLLWLIFYFNAIDDDDANNNHDDADADDVNVDGVADVHVDILFLAIICSLHFNLYRCVFYYRTIYSDTISTQTSDILHRIIGQESNCR